MARDKLKPRRPSLTEAVNITLDGGKELKVLITVGFRDDAMTIPAEVFTADFKAGTAIHAIIMDACIMLSRLLQHGDSPADLAATFCKPPSLIGAIAEAVSNMTKSSGV